MLDYKLMWYESLANPIAPATLRKHGAKDFHITTVLSNAVRDLTPELQVPCSKITSVSLTFPLDSVKDSCSTYKPKLQHKDHCSYVLNVFNVK